MTDSTIHTVRSYVYGQWHTATEDLADVVNPSTEEVVAHVSSTGIDFEKVIAYGRDTGGKNLRAMTFGERAAMLKGLSRALKEHRQELLDLSKRVGGATESDGSFDIDGAGGTLAYYGLLGKRLGDRRVLVEEDGIQPAKTEHFWVQHVKAPRRGVVLAINAFNFPAWGLAEKAACAWLAGVPVIAKPATATSPVAERFAHLMIESGLLPPGALQLICGRTGDLIDRLGSQDMLAFTGSADTALKLRGGDNLHSHSTRINVEADSLNAAVLAPNVAAGSDTLTKFIKDVAREMTQKTGQKCTAVRRIFVPEDMLDTVQHDLIVRLRKVKPGNPVDDQVRMGPLATAHQLADAVGGVEELEADGAVIVHGTGRRCDGIGVEPGKGFFFGPTLLRHDDPQNAGTIHRREVFGPVATLMPYSGRAEEAAQLVALGSGTLVTSVYGDDSEWLGAFTFEAAPYTGRVYVGSEQSSGFGSGAALPQANHGGPGRAGGGSELGGLAGLDPYLQRLAIQGDRALTGKLFEPADNG